MKTRIKTGIAVLLFAPLFATQAYARPTGFTNESPFNNIVKEDIPVRYHFNGGIYTDWAGNPHTDYIEEKTDESGRLRNYYAYMPKKDGYVCIGWSREKDVMNKETACFSDTVYEQTVSGRHYLNPYIPPIDLYAYWAEDKSASGCHIVKFFATEGGKVEPVYLHTNAEGKLPYYPIAEREGYRFRGWSDSWGAFSDEYRPDENTVYTYDTELFSHWEDENANKIKISFDPNGGTVEPKEMMIEKGSTLQPIPIPEREGYEFRFWANTAAMFGDGDPGDADVDENTVFHYDTMLFAHWKKTTGGWERAGDMWSYRIGKHLLLSNWKEINGSWYYFDENGKMWTGWLNHGGNWYYLSEKADENQGKMMTGWQQIEGNWYYFYPNASNGKPAGAMASDTMIDGFRLDKNGRWIS